VDGKPLDVVARETATYKPAIGVGGRNGNEAPSLGPSKARNDGVLRVLSPSQESILERRMTRTREEQLSPPEESSIVDDVPSLPVPDVTARRKPTGPKPGKETPGGWRR
jgi:hypothetical protein